MRFEKLGNIADLIAGQSPPSSSYNGDGNGMPFFQGKADYGEKYPTIRYWCTQPTKIALPGDILISMRAPVGPVNINTIEACIGRGLSAIRVKQNTDRDYLYFWLKQHQHIIAAKETGSTFKAITQKTLSEILIPCPSYEDQRHIAQLLSQAEQLIAQRQESLRLLDAYLKSTFLEMFGDPAHNLKGWKELTLKDVCLKIQDGTHFSPQITSEGIPYVTAKHVRENIVDFWSNPWFISQESHNAIYKRCSPVKGDVLYIKDGATTGYAAINPYDFEFSMLSSLALLKPNPRMINSEYLCGWLNNPNAKRSIISKMAGGAIKRLTLTKINALPILVPPIEVQTQFAQIVTQTELLKTQYQQSLAELEHLYGSLCQRAFRGELGNESVKNLT